MYMKPECLGEEGLSCVYALNLARTFLTPFAHCGTGEPPHAHQAGVSGVPGVREEP